MSGDSILGLRLPVAAIIGVAAVLGYLVVSARRQRGDFGWSDAMILVAIMAIASAGGIAAIGNFGEGAQSAALSENLRVLRTRIELYKVEHGSQAPLLYKGGFPQLTHATNAEGVPGPTGKDYPFGPYFPAGIPVNPYSGSSEVHPCEEFPPTKPTSSGGWLYHQPTGRIAADQDGHLHQ